MANDNRIVVATILMMVGAMLSAVDSVFVRVLTTDLHPFVIVFFRSLFGLLMVAPFIVKNRMSLRSHYRLLHVVRAALKMLSLAAFFTAIAFATLADVSAIAFTTPLFVTVGAWLFLREAPVPRRIVAVLLGFVGAWIILQPSQGQWSTPLLFALAGALLTAIIQLLLKVMSAHDSTETLVAWNLIVSVPLAAIPLIWFWNSPSTAQFALLALEGAVGVLNMTCMTRALSLAQASYVAPLEFVRLPFVALLAYLFFAEIPTNSTLTGAIVIFLSTLLLANWAKSDNFRARNKQ